MKELDRQLLHLFFGTSFVFLLYFQLIKPLHLFLLIVVAISLSFISQKRPLFLISRFLHRYERDIPLVLFPAKGLIFYFIGIFFSVLIAPLDIALAAIMILALGDSMSHLFGLHLGKTRHPFSEKKNLEGFLAGIVFGFVGALVFVPWHEALIASIGAMLVEGIDWKLGLAKVDDNLLIPIIASIIILMVRFAF